MYRLTHLLAEDFRSFRRVDLAFPTETAVTHVTGADFDRGGASNGAGKSTIPKAILWGLTGETDAGTTAKDYIRRGATDAAVEVSLVSSATGDEVRVRRTVGRKRPVRASIWVNGELDGDSYDAKAVSERLSGLLGFDAADLSRFSFISQGNDFSFATATDAQRKALVGRVARLDRLDDALTRCRGSRDKYRAKVDNLRLARASAETRLEVLREAVDVDVSPGPTEAEAAAAEIAVARATGLSEEAEAAYRVAAERFAADWPESRRRELMRERSDRESELIAATSSVVEAQTHVERLERLAKDSAVSCPSCGHAFSYDISAAELERRSTEWAERLSVRSEAIPGHEKRLADAIRALDAFDDGRTTARGDVDALAHDRDVRTGDLARARGEYAEVDRRRRAHLAEVAARDKAAAKVAEAEAALSEADAAVAAAEARLADLDYWTVALGSTGAFRSRLARKVLGRISAEVNAAMEEFGAGFRIEVSGYTEKADGTSSDKISVTAVRDDGERFKIPQLSGGQKTRIKLCCILALARMLNGRPGTEGLDLITLDETLDSIDAEGTAAAERIMRDSGATFLVVSHQPQFGQQANRLEVRREGGVSEVAWAG